MVTLSELCLFSHILPQNDALCGEKRVAQWKIVKGRKIGEGRLSSSQPVELPPEERERVRERSEKVAAGADSDSRGLGDCPRHCK